MEFPVQPLLGMFLPQQRQGADALNDVVFPTIGCLRIMNGRSGDFAAEIEAIGKKRREGPVGADGDQAAGVVGK